MLYYFYGITKNVITKSHASGKIKNHYIRILRRKTVFPRSRDQCAANWCTSFDCSLGLGFGDRLGLWLSSGHLLLSGNGLGLLVRVLGYGFGVRGRKVKSRDCALASDLVRSHKN